jgi:hypothetical protein
VWNIRTVQVFDHPVVVLDYAALRKRVPDFAELE